MMATFASVIIAFTISTCAFIVSVWLLKKLEEGD